MHGIPLHDTLSSASNDHLEANLTKEKEIERRSEKNNEKEAEAEAFTDNKRVTIAVVIQKVRSERE